MFEKNCFVVYISVENLRKDNLRWDSNPFLVDSADFFDKLGFLVKFRVKKYSSYLGFQQQPVTSITIWPIQ